MSTPQQPELARSRRTPADAEHAKDVVTRQRAPRTGNQGSGPVPEDNRPGHRPEVEQDKPLAPPRSSPTSDRGEAGRDGVLRFAFLFEPRILLFGVPFGITPWTTGVEVKDDRLLVRFGPWSLTTGLDNVVDASMTGPYSLFKVVGPPRLSLVDRGVTFATTSEHGVCIRFRDPVAGALPFGLLRHPAATVTVAEPAALVEAVTRHRR